MPVTEDEFEAGAVDEVATPSETDAVGEFETEKDLIIAFLGRNVNNAYSESEIVRGVDFGESVSSETVSQAVFDVPSRMVDVAGDLAATAIVVADVEDALDELVEEGIVEANEVETEDGPVTYYRISD